MISCDKMITIDVMVKRLLYYIRNMIQKITLEDFDILAAPFFHYFCNQNIN